MENETTPTKTKLQMLMLEKLHEMSESLGYFRGSVDALTNSVERIDGSVAQLATKEELHELHDALIRCQDTHCQSDELSGVTRDMQPPTKPLLAAMWQYIAIGAVGLAVGAGGVMVQSCGASSGAQAATK